jgi:carboxymethylenebutenolidase
MSLGTATTINGPNGENIPAFEFGQVNENGAAVVLLQEWWGVDENIKWMADKLASKGYRVLVPDLYKGKVALDVAEARHSFGSLNWPLAVQEISACVDFLSNETGVKKVGVTGFCMGGALSLGAAAVNPKVRACAPFYGANMAIADLSKISCPVLWHSGVNDQSPISDTKMAATLKEFFTTNNIPHEIFVLEGVGHAYMNETEPAIKRRKDLGQGDHDQQMVDESWDRLLAFFAANLH